MRIENLVFIEGIVDDVIIDTGYPRGMGRYRYKYVTIRLKVSENRFVDVRIQGYLSPITIVRGHRVRAYGEWISESIFRAIRVEDLTTGELWEVRSRTSILIVFIAFLTLTTAIFLTMLIMPFTISRYFEIIMMIMFILVILFIVATIHTWREPHRMHSF